MATQEPVIGFRVGVFNWRLRRAREAMGWTQKQLADESGVNVHTLNSIEALRSRGSFEIKRKLAFALERGVEELFPEVLQELHREGVCVELPVSEQALHALQSNRAIESVDDKLRHEALTEGIEQVLAKLQPREALVLRRRFGLGGDEPKTFGDVGEELGVTRERVRQIEAKALKRLRRPALQRELVPLAEEAGW